MNEVAPTSRGWFAAPLLLLTAGVSVLTADVSVAAKPDRRESVRDDLCPAGMLGLGILIAVRERELDGIARGGIRGCG